MLQILNASFSISVMARVGVVWYTIVSVPVVKVDHTTDLYHSIPGPTSVAGT